MEYQDAKQQLDALFDADNATLKTMHAEAVPATSTRLQGGLMAPKGGDAAYREARDTYLKAVVLRQYADQLAGAVRPTLQQELTRMDSMQTDAVIDEHGGLRGDQDMFPIGPKYALKIIQEMERDIKARINPGQTTTTRPRG